MAAVLLDTCAMIFVANGDPIDRAALRKIERAILDGGVLVSPVSAWEIGLLAARKGIGFLPDPASWFADFLARGGVQLAPFTPEIGIASSFLPLPLHGDPADRLLIATARALSVPLVTRDREILAYGAARHVAVVAC